MYICLVYVEASPFLSKSALTTVSEDSSRLILAIENVVSNVKVSLSAVDAANPQMNSSTRSFSTRQTLTHLSPAPNPPASPTTKRTGTSAIASQGNASRLTATQTSSTEQINNLIATAKQSSEISQQAASVNLASLTTSSTQISQSQSPTSTVLPGSFSGGTGSATITPFPESLNIVPDYSITNAFGAGLSTTTI